MKIRNLFQIFLAVMMMAMFAMPQGALAQGTGSSFSITVTADPAEGGTVTGGSSGSYAKDTQLEFKETPNEGYRFKNWTINGIPGGSEDTYPFIVDGNFSTVVAHFERVYTLSGSHVFFFPEGSYDPITVAAEGETVVVSANPELTPNGKYLSGYTAPKGVTLTMGEYDATFTMPAMDVTVDPVYTDQEEYTVDLTTSTSAAVPDMVFFMLQRLGSDSQYLDLNGDGTNDLELTVNQDFTTFYVTKLEGGYSKDTHVALVTYPIDNSQYNSVFFKLGNEVGGEAKDIKTLTITLSGTEFTYTGQPIEPTVTVKDGNTSVAVTLDYSNNTNAAESTATNAPTVTVTANAAGYTGSVTKTFTIAPKEVKVSGLSAEEKNYDPNNNVATINCRGAVFNGLIEGDELTISDVTGTYKIGENVDATLDVTLDYTNATLGGKSAANYKLATEDNQATTIITIHKVSQTVTITFDPNGGTGELDLQSVPKGETVRLKDNTFYRQGYSFKNWNTKADGSGDKYEDRQLIKIDEDLTLYAQWKEQNIIETNIETKKNLDGSTTTIVTSKETDSSGKLVKESNTSTTNFLDGSKKVSESKTPETDGKRVYVSEDGTVTGIDLGNSMLFGGVSRDNIVGIIQNSTQGSGESDAQPDILIAQGNESNVLVNKETEIDPQGEVTATSASLTVKQTGDTEGATGKSKPTQIAINAGGGVNTNAPTSGKFGNFTWEVSKSDANSTVYDVLTISGSGEMIEGSPWDAYQNQIKTVIFESVISEEDNMEGVTSIGNEAFQYFSSLTSVTIPAGVTSIGDMAFNDCSSLKSVTIPAGVTSIGVSAFNGCSAMTSLTFAEGSQLQTIGDYAFYGLTSLTSDIILPASVTSIGQDAFASVPENTTDGNHVYITVPDGKKLKVMIAGVTDPVEITPTNGKADIIDCLFANRAERIASRALTLKIVDASTGGEGGGDNGGGSENPDAPTSGKMVNLTWEVSKSDANSTVYDVLTISGSDKMEDGSPWDAYQNQIKTVIIGEGVTSIGNEAFSGCSSLTSVTIPAGVTSIGESVFKGCSSLTSVDIPASVKSIGKETFNGCSAMTSLTFAEGSQLQTIGDYAFYGLISLASDITLPAGVTSIGNSAFDRVSKNTTVGISITAAAGSQLTAIDTYAFSAANASIDLSNCTQLEAIGSDLVFNQVTGDVTLPSSVTRICQYAFGNQYSYPYPGKHVYVTVLSGKKLKVMIAGVTDPVEFTPTNGKADIINCLFDDPSIRIASRALTLKIVDPSTGDDNGGGSASGQGQEPSTREKNDRAAKTMIVNYEKEKTGSAGGNSSVVSSPEEVHSTAATAGSLEGEGGAGADPDLVKGDHNTGGTTAGSRAATAEEEDDEIEIVSGREYEILHDGFIVLNFYTAGGSITVNSIIIRSPGDANNDGYVNAADIVEMINAKNGKASERFNLTNADIDRDGTITQRDIDFVVKLIMEPKDKGDE